MAEHIKVEIEEQNHPLELPAQIEVWKKHHVKQWALRIEGLDHVFADILFQQHYNGTNLLKLDKSDFLDLKIPLGQAKLILHARDNLLKRCDICECTEKPINASRTPCKPYAFNRHHDACRYRVNHILDVIESGPTNYIEPCHEFKAYIHTPEESKIDKFIEEVIRFGAGCMNSRTNGTIHFGVGDKPEFKHGQVLGVEVDDKEEYENALKLAIEWHFEFKHIEAAKKCFKPPRFVEVLNPDTTASAKYVIEVDIVPNYIICEDSVFHVYSGNRTGKKTKSKGKNKESDKLFYIRDGSSSRNLLAQSTSSKPMEQFNKFCSTVTQLSQMRKQAEESRPLVAEKYYHSPKLSQMITGGSESLDKSHFQQYVIVTNKSHTIHLESLGFLIKLKPVAVLDFDPESGINGLQKHFEMQSTINVHLPVQYKITEAIEEIARKLKLTRNTSWIFCNGGVNDAVPSDTCDWLIDKGASVRDVISFLCRKDVLPHRRYLVIFLLLTTVTDKMDPLIETFSTFWQELKGKQQILCICENENSFTSWKDLIETRYGIDISERCIYTLSFAEINGAVLSLWSDNRKFSRFLPCSGQGKVQLDKKVESGLDTLEVLCVNQCEGGSEDKASIEEKFYKGGKASWWNFYFSEQPGSTPFIKRDKFDFIVNTVIPDLGSQREACVSFNLKHIPGCGGTTLAMHILWSLKEKYRCVVLKNRTVNFAEASRQVVTLLQHDSQEQSHRLPVLLMVDDFEEMDRVYDLQQHIEKECVNKNIGSSTPQVIILNCMRAETWEQTEITEDNDTVFIGINLSVSEQNLFNNKLKEIEKTHSDVETFYGFMIMKKNFSQDYIQGVARNTLKSFNLDNKNAQLIAVLALLKVYCKRASLSASLCEEFLGLQTKPYCGTIKVEDGFGMFSTLITDITVYANVEFNAWTMIHSMMALYCLEELTNTYGVTKGQITNLLLTIDKFYECHQGKEILMNNIHDMLVKRHHAGREKVPTFSPLIQDILNETSGVEETVLSNAAKRFDKHAVISQLLARYYYLKKNNFIEAETWAKRAKELESNNSYIADTSAQVIKHKLNYQLTNNINVPMEPDRLKLYLKLSVSATKAFRETQNCAKKESAFWLQNKINNRSFNTVGFHGEIQVALIVIKILKQTPVFSSNDIRHDILGEVLSGKMSFHELKENDPLHSKLGEYYCIFQEFDNLLCNLRKNMKKNFDFLDYYFVHLFSIFPAKNGQKEILMKEHFKQYVDLFCKTNTAELMKDFLGQKASEKMLQVPCRSLEKNKADTYSGILGCVARGTSVEIMEEIAHMYNLLQTNHANDEMLVNSIYANVTLSWIKPDSKQLLPFETLISILWKVLQKPIRLEDSLSVHYIAVALLWPHRMLDTPAAQCKSLGSYVSQMRASYHAEMMSVCNGKRPVVHCFLGKKQGYDRLIHLGEIERCVPKGKEQYFSLWHNGKTWKEKAVEQLLFRLTGKKQKQYILADTFNEGLKIEVRPMFRSQLSGRPEGSEVSFYLGFSLKGPLAIDIE